MCRIIRVSIIFLLASLASFNFTRALETTCSLNVNSDLTKVNLPLMITKIDGKYELVRPEKIDKHSLINVDQDHPFLVLCPGENNQLDKLEKKSAAATCEQNQLQFKTESVKIENTSEFQCTRQLEPILKNTGEKCGESDSGTIFEAGYQVDTISTWFPMLTTCHDITNMNTYYSIHTLIGKSIDARQKFVPRPPDFFVGNLKELFDKKSPNKFYTKANAVTTFQNIFRPLSVDKYVDLKDNYLSRGHLAPDADMLFSSWKVPTYFFINVAPQWQKINAGNWLKVENEVRKAAALLQDDLTIITGTYGVMKMKIGKKEQQIYLNPENKLKVPECFWKVVYHGSSKTAIVIVTSNNPYQLKAKTLCRDICEKSNWANREFYNVKKGYTYCCTYESFKKVVQFVPELEVQGILQMPKKPSNARFKSAIREVIKDNRRRRLTKKQK